MDGGDASGETGPRPRDYVGLAEAARMLRVSPKVVARWAGEGRLPYETGPAGERRFRRADIDDLVRRLRGEA